MSNLFTSLTSATRALDAQRFGLDVVGQNLANVNTPGYARRVVDLQSVQPDGPRSAGRGVDIVGVRALRDRLLENRLGRELAPQAREAAIAEALGIAEIALGQPGESLDAALGRFFNAFGALAENPTSSVVRQQVQLDGASLATSFRSVASRFDAARADADRHVRGTVAEINALAKQVAAFNVAIGNAASEEATLHLEDNLSEVVRKLSVLVDADIRPRAEGGVDVTIGHGRPLVVGETAYEVVATATAPAGFAALSLGSLPITPELTGGRLGGYLHVRDTALPAYRADLDALAFAAVNAINAAHEAGFDLDGGAGGQFFELAGDPLDPEGAAGRIRVSAAVAGNPRAIAAGGSPDAGSNEAARAIAALRDARLLDGGTATLVDGWAEIVYVVGRDVAAATHERDTRAAIVRQVEALRDQVSGVSLDEEAMLLMKFQRAYEANARFFRAIDQALDTLLNALAR